MAGRGQVPNWGAIAQASNELNQNVQTITQELAHIQNVGNVELANALQDLRQAMTQGFQEVTQGFQDVNDQFDIMEITLQEIEVRAAEREERSIVRARNAGLKYHEVIEPILVNGQGPNNFPHTVGQLASLGGRQTNDILAFYGLPINGNLDARRHRLAMFLGVYLDF